MHNTVRTVIFLGWLVFWIYWIAQAANANPSTTNRRRRPIALSVFAVGYVVSRVLGVGTLAVGPRGLVVAGIAAYLAGLAFAIWARLHLGRNWGIPMSQRVEPELVTSGPYRFVRHPIYTGILLASLGTGLATNYYWLAVTALLASYFIYAARIEERNMTAEFPDAYPAYRERSKMLIPLLF
jgi:protein-S-isoprenylcysteine O-methyltransferase Ste14